MAEQFVPSSRARASAGQWVGGVILIGLGVLALLARFIDASIVGLAILPGIGVAFAAWGIATRRSGLMVPAGILMGLGAGTFLVAGPLGFLGEPHSGGVFLAAFAGGWGLVTLLTALFTERTFWWPLIPGGVMACLAGMLLAGEGALMLFGRLMGWAWPLALMGVGVWLVVRRARSSRA